MSRVVIRRHGTTRPDLVLELIGDDTLAGGHGGWEVLDRPGRSAMTEWAGTPGLTWVLPLSFEGITDRGATSVERDVATLESWGLPGKDDDRPPALIVDAPLGRASAGSKWVIQTIEWGAQVRNDAGDRIRQDINLTLLEYIPGQVLKGPAAKARGAGKKHKWVPISAKDRRCKVCKKPRGDKQHTNRTGGQ